MDEGFLRKKLEERKRADAFRQLKISAGMVDLCSNDYLGIVKNRLPVKENHPTDKLHGSTGSRLLSGNYELIEELEKDLAAFHDAEAGLVFNSGYDANLGLLSCIPQRGDTILYDQLCHASLRDGIRLSLAAAYSFIHNDPADLEKKLSRSKGKIFVVTESVFSMDGDLAPLAAIAGLCHRYRALLIVDEAHATGVIGLKGEGLVQHLDLQQACFARIHTFGKAVGSHGAIVLGSALLKEYLVNFSRPFIFTTALPASAVLATCNGYTLLKKMEKERLQLSQLIHVFRKLASGLNIKESSTPIQAMVIPGNSNVKKAATLLQENNFDVRPILSPTVPEGSERLRVVLHAFNSEAEIKEMMKLLSDHYGTGTSH